MLNKKDFGKKLFDKCALNFFLVVLSDVEIVFRSITNNFKIAEEEVARDDPPKVLQTFVDEHKPTIARITEKLEQAKQEYARCAHLYGEDMKTQGPREFFTIINDFMHNFDAAHALLKKRTHDKVCCCNCKLLNAQDFLIFLQENSAIRPTIVKQEKPRTQPTSDKAVVDELRARFKGPSRERRLSIKPQHNQVADGEFERLMMGERFLQLAARNLCCAMWPIAFRYQTRRLCRDG